MGALFLIARGPEFLIKIAYTGFTKSLIECLAPQVYPIGKTLVMKRVKN
jgi:hypothetical protein